MDLYRLIASCSYCERQEAIEKSINNAKYLKVTVVLTIYKNSLSNKVTVFINKRSQKDKILKYVEKQLV